MNAPPTNRTVLIVDDEPFIRVVLSDLFEDAGFTVEEASSAAEAMVILEGLGFCIDLLLTDVKMLRNGSKADISVELNKRPLSGDQLRRETTITGALRTWLTAYHEERVLTLRLNSSSVLPSAEAPSR